MGSKIREIIGDLDVLEPVSRGGLQVFGVRRRGGGGRIPYATLDESLDSGQVAITEVGEEGSVPDLKITNRSEGPVLLVAGEELVGAKQNRVLNSSILVAAKSELVLPVSCVEAGRWRHVSARFASGETTSHASLRALVADQVSASYRRRRGARSDQGAVWKEIDRKLAAMGSRSGSAALHQVYEDHRARLAEVGSALRPPAGSSGAVFAHGGRIAGMDVFDRPETFEKAWPKLVRGYAVDAMEGPAESPAVDRRGVEEWLRSAAGVEEEPFDSPGAGTDLRLRGESLVGASLVVDGEALHTELFSSSP